MSEVKWVYVINAKTDKVDDWILDGEISAIYQGKKETVCLLRKGRKSCALPKRCVFETEEAARAVLNRK